MIGKSAALSQENARHSRCRGTAALWCVVMASLSCPPSGATQCRLASFPGWPGNEAKCRQEHSKVLIRRIPELTPGPAD